MSPTLPAWNEIRLVLPEIWLAVAMCAVLLAPLAKNRASAVAAATAVGGLLLALGAALLTLGDARGPVLSGMLAIDPFGQFFKVLLMGFVLLVMVQWLTAGWRGLGERDVPDFLCLLLGATLGMALMASSTNLLMIVIAIESASLPSYVLGGLRKRLRVGSESALKYVLIGAAATAVMMYGISLIYGLTGTLDVASLAARVAGAGVSPLLAIGLMGLLVGIAFKLSAVPLHFWCPDVFEGAPMEVTTFLSVASKGAAVVLLVRVLFSLAGAAEAVGDCAASVTGIAVAVGALGAVTATWGNLVGLRQTNIKRLLAYSCIAHAGYMIMAASVMALTRTLGPGAVVAGTVALSPVPTDVAAAILFYLLVYLFMNTGAFTVAAVVSDRGGGEDIRDYAGLVTRSPLLAVLLAVFLLSLFGMPGLGGFLGKIYIAVAMAQLGGWGFVLIAVLLFNTLLSLYYYLRPVYYMVLLPDAERRAAIPVPAVAVALLVLCAAALLWTGLSGGTILARDYAILGASASPAPIANP